MIQEKTNLSRFAIGAVLVLAFIVIVTPLLSGALNVDERSALALLPLATVLVFALYVAMYIGARSVLGDRLAGALTAVTCIFVASAIFRLRAYADKSIDWQVAMRLAAFGALFVMSFIFFSHSYGKLRFPPLFFNWLLFFSYIIVCSLYSPNVSFSFGCAVLFLICYLSSVYMTVWLSRPRAILVMILAATFLCLGSIVVYVFIPAFGRMQAWMPNVGIADVGRMKGLVGSANGIGFVSAFAIVIAILYQRTIGRFGKVAAAIVIPSAVLCLYLSNSRSSMISVVTAIWLSFVLRKGAGLKFFVSGTLGLIGAVILIGFYDEIFSLISRSGNTREITNVTGRTEIWAVVIEMWMKSPFIGYGYSASLYILPLDPRLFRTAAHAHNMVLELLFSGGIILAGIFLYAIATTISQLIRMRAANEAVLLFFFLLHGLVEASPFNGMPGYSSFAFTLTLALIVAKQIEERALAGIAPTHMPVSGLGAAPALQRLRQSQASVRVPRRTAGRG